MWDAARNGITLFISSSENKGGCGGCPALARMLGRAGARGRRFSLALGKPALTSTLSERYCVLLCQTRLSVSICRRATERGIPVTNNPVTRLSGPVLVPVVDGTQSEEHGYPPVATHLVTAIIQRAERLCPVT